MTPDPGRRGIDPDWLKLAWVMSQAVVQALWEVIRK